MSKQTYNQLEVDEMIAEARKELSDAYDEYIKLLGDENSELTGLAFAHGWKSTRYQAGIDCRKKIEQLKQKYGG